MQGVRASCSRQTNSANHISNLHIIRCSLTSRIRAIWRFSDLVVDPSLGSMWKEFVRTSRRLKSPTDSSLQTKQRCSQRCRNESDPAGSSIAAKNRSEEHTSELQSQSNLVCRLLLEKKK